MQASTEYQHLASCPVRPRTVSTDERKVDRDPVPAFNNNDRGGIGDATNNGPMLTKLLEVFTQFFSLLQRVLAGTDPTNTVPTPVTPLPMPPVTPLPVTPLPSPPVIPRPVLPLPDPRAQVLRDLSSKRNGAKPDNIWNGFRQGPDGNCVTISAIKAAMMKFGQSPTDIFKSVRGVGDGYHVEMRDGYRLDLKKDELEKATRASRFVLMTDSGMLKDAHFLFAVSAKRAMMENNDGTAGRSIEHAIHSLNNGEDELVAGEGFLRLGLRQHMRTVSVTAFRDKSLIGMVNRQRHSVAVIDGCEELYGKKGGAPRFGDAIALV